MTVQGGPRVEIPRQRLRSIPEHLAVLPEPGQPQRPRRSHPVRGQAARVASLCLVDLVVGLVVVHLLVPWRPALLVPPTWLGLLVLTGRHRQPPVGKGADLAALVRLAVILVVVVEAIGWRQPAVQEQLLVALGLVVLVSIVLRGAAQAVLPLRVVPRALLIGDEQAVARTLEELQQLQRPLADVVCIALTASVGHRNWPMPVVDLEEVPFAVQEHDGDVVLVLPSPELDATRLRSLAWGLEPTRTPLLVSAGLTDVRASRVAVLGVGNSLLIQVRHTGLRGWRRMAKAGWERAVAAVCLLLVAPLLAVLMVLIRAGSPGPAIFRQVRVGRNGKPFTMLKLRTMSADAEARLEDLADANESAGGVLFKLRADPRVTWIGRFLRRYSLDELPQLWNVVRGDMALVGPRPALPQEVARYDGFARRRLAACPGLTGLWQVSGRSDLSWVTGINLDVHYVDNWSFLLDLAIVGRTVRAVFVHQGAY